MAEVVSIQIDGVHELNQALTRFAKGIADPDKRREIALAGVPVVIAGIQSETPIYNKPFHYRYDTPKLIGKLRAPKGMGRIAAKYAAGNLKNSTIDLATRKSKYKKLPFSIIAPFYARKKGDGGKRAIGTTPKNADGYYAHMVYGSARAYQQKVLIKGLNKVAKTALTQMLREADQVINKQKKKNGLNADR